MFSIRLGRRSLAAMVAACGIGGALAAPVPTDDGWEDDIFVSGKAYHVRAFTKTGDTTWPVPDGVTAIDYLVVGGGGGGGYQIGGGGGGGGFKSGTAEVTAGDVLSITVGAGGAGGNGTDGGDGTPSTLSVADGITAGGGGGGGKLTKAGHSGACGGGGSRAGGGTGTAGGNGASGSGNLGGGGGGAGGNASGTTGGVGKESEITGAPVMYAGGGGAGVNLDAGLAGGTGKNGGGNGGGKYDGVNTDAQPGTDGLGGGGGGGAHSKNLLGADGGDGIVIVRYEVQSEKNVVDIPEKMSRSYTGEVQKAPIEDTADYTVSGNVGWSVVGTYAVTVTLRDTSKSCWSDGSDTPKDVEFEIVKADVDLSGVTFADTAFDYDGNEHELVISGELPEVVTVRYENNVRTALGSQTATAIFALVDSDNYNLPEPMTAVLTVKPAGTGDPDTQNVTYTWKEGIAAGLWAGVGNWSGSAGATYGFPANNFATASFPTGEFEVTGDENAYTIVDVVKANGGTVTLKGGTYAMTKTGTDIRSIGTGALVLDGASLTSACVWRPQGRIELKNGAAYTFTTGRIRPDGGLVATDSTLNGFLDLQNSGTCVSVSNSTVTLSTIEFGDTTSQKSQTIEFCNGSTVTLNGDLTVAGTDNTFVLDDSQFTQAANKSTSFTGANSRMVIRGAAPKFDATSGKAFSAPVTFVLPTDAYEAAPLQLKVGAPTVIVVDNSIVGTPETSVTYPLVTRASVFEASDLACVTVPPFVTVALSADRKTIQVTVLGADKLHQVAFLDSDGQTVLREAETVVDGETVSGVPSDPFHEGYVFVGWSADEGETVLSGNEVAALPITSDMTFVAQYKTSEKTAVTDPQIATSAAYTGLENKPVVPEDEGYTVDWGEGEWITVGTYTVTLKLSDPEKYVWSDGTSDDKVHPFEITQAENSWTTEPTIPTSWAQGSMPDYSLGAAAFGTVTLSCADGELDQLEIGKHTVVFLVVGTDNYTGLEKQVAVKVRPQGLDPTGEDDTVAGDYSWKDGIAEGYWFNPASWTMSEGLTYGYPASELVTAWIKDLTGPVTAVGEEDETVLAAIRMQNSDVALVGGNYRTTKSEKWSGSSQPGSFEFKGEGKTLSVTDTKLTVAGMAFFGKGTTLASTNAVWDTSARIWVVQQNVKLDFDRSDVNYISIGCGNANGEITLHDTTVGTIDCQPGSDVKISLTGTSKITTDFNPAACSGVSVYVGPQASVTRAKNTMLGASSSLVVDGGTFKVNTSGGYLDNAGQSITLQNGAQSDLWTQMGIRGNALGSIFTVDDSTVHAGHTFYCSECAGDSVFAFKGAVPRVIHDKALYQCLFGNSDTEKSETTPVVRFILPQTPYENAPFETSATKVNTLFYANTPIELDVTAVRGKGSYPLFKFNNGVNADLLYSTDSAAFVEMLGSCLRAYRTSKNGRQADRTERVTLRVDGNVIYADVAAAPGFSLIVR